MPQNRINILSTRNIDHALVQDASSKNIGIDVISFIKTERVLTSTVLNEVQKALVESATVVFTSSNAVEAIAASLDLPRTNPFRWKIFCIGQATKHSVVKYFGERLIAGVADNAKELARAILDGNVRDIIFFCGDQRRDELPGLLRKNSVHIQEIVVYQTIATPEKVEKNYDGILFFSPSAVKSFFEKNIAGDQTVLFAIGNTTADEIKNFSKNKVMIGDSPDAKVLLQKAIEFFQTNPIHH